ncbi:MAG: NAD(P)H-dependent oxidoreductase [Alphaproteobacteria bacterium]|nr:NAD(P)H-dependent oxidoreductase [Alphaproteobacteria bacterium]
MKRILSVILLITTFFMGNNAIAEVNDMNGKKVLVVYFSRTGEQYGVGNITEGNTAIIAKMIAKKTDGDAFEVKLKNDNYPSGYTPLTEVAKEEKNNNARPEILDDINNFSEYDVIFVGGPVWWSDLPMAMYTFIDRHDWSGKIVVPFVTHEGSGLTMVPDNLKKATQAEMLDGLAVYGHIAQNEHDKAEKIVANWLNKLGF